MNILPPEDDANKLPPPTQMPLLEGMPERVLGVPEVTRKAIKKGAAHANPAWVAFAYDCGIEIARSMKEFTINDISDLMHSKVMDNKPVTHDERALGGVMRGLVSNHIALNTKIYQNSRRKDNNGCPRPIYNSLIFSPMEGRCTA